MSKKVKKNGKNGSNNTNSINTFFLNNSFKKANW